MQQVKSQKLTASFMSHRQAHELIKPCRESIAEYTAIKQLSHQRCRCIHQNKLVVALMTDSNKIYKQLYSIVEEASRLFFMCKE